MKQLTNHLLTLFGAGTLLGISTGCKKAPEAQQRPNILFIMSDDHAYQAISAYNDRFKDVAPTPHIDEIANEGMIFNRCLVSNSLSGPSRATLLTGKYNHINGFLENEGNMPFDGKQETFVKLLRGAGYQTAIIGKWHLVSNPTGFDYWDVLPDQGQYYNPVFMDSTGKKIEPGYVTEIITRKTIDWLKKASQSGKPFLMMMHHKAPHRQWQPGPHELGMYNNVTFPEPPTLFDDYANRGVAEKEQEMIISKNMRLDQDLKLNEDTVNLSGGLNRMNPQQRALWNKNYYPITQKFYSEHLTGKELVRYKYQRYLQDYLACIAGVDKSVGEVLDYLKKTGLDKNTIVVYTSDQGFFLGEHGWFDKRWMFEQSYRTPLLIKWPGVIKPGSVNNDMVSNLDYAETFLDAAGVKIPSDMQGMSILPILKGHTPANWRTEHYYEYFEYPGWHSVKRHYGISNKRYKLIHYYYDIDQWELYDREKDPLELKNVYNDPAYAKVRAYLHVRLDSLRAKYHDTDSLDQSFLPKNPVKIRKYK